MFPHLKLKEKLVYPIKFIYMKAIWNGQVIAESNECINIENNQYFPLSAIKMEFLQKTETQTTCPWKGEASYYNIVVDGEINEDAAWFYKEPKTAAKHIKNYIAFWKSIKITN